ncbi:MAG TPA: CHAT domain-containing protein, partial [Kofleriaceae bacterium]|nr:CHAT domain-containing protein [Kofleriaceae bacterium]
ASEFAQVLRLLGETLGVRAPDRCAVAIAVQDQQAVVAFADATGAVGGQYTAALAAPALELDARTLVPPAIAARLIGCDRVAVLTRAPALGAGRLLPPALAWSFVLSRVPGDAAPPALAGSRLVVANPEPPPDLQLPPLGPDPEAAAEANEPAVSGRVVLRGADATPARVLQAMRDAAVIELHSHGVIANDASEASYLVLSPEPDGAYKLTANDIEHVKLAAAPLVILGACHAATSSRSLEGGIGLPEAFLRSGARAVIASPDAVQDLGAREFFAGVRDRVMHGADPAIAVRDERLQRVGLHDRSWISGVVVFE